MDYGNETLTKDKNLTSCIEECLGNKNRPFPASRHKKKKGKKNLSEALEKNENNTNSFFFFCEARIKSKRNKKI